MRLGAALPWGRKDTALPPNEQTTPVRACVGAEEPEMRAPPTLLRPTPCPGLASWPGGLRFPQGSLIFSLSDPEL